MASDSTVINMNIAHEDKTNLHTMGASTSLRVKITPEKTQQTVPNHSQLPLMPDDPYPPQPTVTVA